MFNAAHSKASGYLAIKPLIPAGSNVEGRVNRREIAAGPALRLESRKLWRHDTYWT